jgi:(4S)-4-hydroxy-5-phosphonooxypentane-2,3-dione isomerase
VQAFHEAIVENAGLSLETEPGCRQFDVCRRPGDPTLFFLYELYDDEAAFQAHLQSAHFLEMNARTADWVTAKQVWRYWRVHPSSAVDAQAAD